MLLQGFGILELATVRLEEAETVAGQLADELGLGYEDYLAEAGYRMLEKARSSKKATGTPGTTSYLDGARQALEGIDQQEDSEPDPPKGERHKKLVDEGSLLRRRRERNGYELELCSAPVVEKIRGSMYPDWRGRHGPVG